MSDSKQYLMSTSDSILQEGPKHPITGVPMLRCPTCGRFSGLTGIDRKNCLACTIRTGSVEPK